MTTWHSWHALALVAVPFALAACDSSCTYTAPDPDPPLPSAGGAGGTAGAGGGMGGAGGGMGGAGGMAGGGGTGGMFVPTIEVVKEFNASTFELAEGLAVKGNDAWIGFAPLDKAVKVDIAAKTSADFGTVTQVMNTAYLLGLTLDGAGNVYGAVGQVAAGAVPGIYKWPAAGGIATLFASNAGMVFPNGLAFAATGELYVADSGTGKIFKISADGLTVTEWSADPLLKGKLDNCAEATTMFDIGANGIVVDGSTVYVANTNLGTIVRIPIEAGGTAGTATVLAGPDCAALGGADGIALDGNTLYVAVNGQNKIEAVSITDGKTSTYIADAKLQSPASTAIDGGSLYVTNAAFVMGQTPGLVKISLP